TWWRAASKWAPCGGSWSSAAGGRRKNLAATSGAHPPVRSSRREQELPPSGARGHGDDLGRPPGYLRAHGRARPRPAAFLGSWQEVGQMDLAREAQISHVSLSESQIDQS